MARLLRRKSAAVVAFGSCACSAASPASRTCTKAGRSSTSSTARRRAVQNDEATLPAQESDVAEGELSLPAFCDSVRTLDQVIDVDYYLPGCPPPRA